MRRALFVIAFGFAGILAFVVAPASAQHRSGGVSRGSWYYAPVRFFRPYYTFRPRFSLGAGLFIAVRPVLRLLRKIPRHQREQWIPWQPMPAWTKE